MKLVADVNVSRRVVELLREQGVDAVRVTEFMDARSTDEEILSEARARQAVLLSFDQDFSALLAVGGLAAPSLINLRVAEVGAVALAHLVLAVLRATEEDLRAGAVVTIDNSGVRVHRLPLD
jgi:predicted nuclease of predicted toxin-antitoxin system